MSIPIPAATNLARNPKPASLTYIAGSGGVPALAYDRSYVGGTSIVQVTNTGGFITWGAGALSGSLTGVARTFAAAIRVSGGLPTRAYLLITYTDTGQTTGADATLPANLPGDASFTRIDLPPITSDPAKTISTIQAVIRNDSGATRTIYLGGFDLRENVAVDRYVDGDLGAGYAWTGTANDSASTRVAITPVPTLTNFATRKYELGLFIVNRQGVIQDDITDEFVSGSVTYDLEAEGPKGDFRVTLKHRGIITPYADQYLRPTITITESDGSVSGGPLGSFGVEPASERWATVNTFQYNAYDLLWVLQTDTLVNGWLFQQGNPYIAEVLKVLADAGFTPPANVSLPAGGSDLDPIAQTNYGAEKGGSRLDFLNQLLTGAGWELPWVTLNAQFTSRPATPLSTVQPAVTFATGEGSPVRWPFEVDPEPEDIGNRVAVFGKLTAKKGAIKSILDNIDPAHPFSIPRLGRTIVANTVNDDTITTQKAADQLAAANLEKAGMLPLRCKLNTRAVYRQLHEVYTLDLRDEQTGDPIPLGQGAYWCVGWSMNLGQPWQMTHNLKRVIPVGDVL